MPGKQNNTQQQKKSPSNGNNNSQKKKNTHQNNNGNDGKQKIKKVTNTAPSKPSNAPKNIAKRPATSNTKTINVHDVIQSDVAQRQVYLSNFDGTTGQYYIRDVMDYMNYTKNIAMKINVFNRSSERYEYMFDMFMNDLDMPKSYHSKMEHTLFNINKYVGNDSSVVLSPFIRSFLINKFGDIRTDFNVIKKILHYLSWHMILYVDYIENNRDANGNINMSSLDYDLCEAATAYYILTRMYKINTSFDYTIPTAAEFFNIYRSD